MSELGKHVSKAVCLKDPPFSAAPLLCLPFGSSPVVDLNLNVAGHNLTLTLS
jgi:hypothetical protein